MPYNPTMPKNRIIPALAIFALVPLAVWAQTPPQTPPAAGTPVVPGSAPVTPVPSLVPGPVPNAAPAGPGAPAAAEEPPTEAEKELDAAIKKVEALKSVSADILQKVEMLGQRFELKGQYLKASNYRVYLKLSVTGLGDTTGTMLQVCDGSTLWDFQQVLDSKGFLRLDLAKILKRLESAEFDSDMKSKVFLSIGFSGPESLLVGLRKALKFEHKDADTLDGKAVWVLRGKWKDMSKLASPNQAPMPATAPLPPYIPSMATLWIGQDDGWPYKVLLEGRIPSVLENVDTRQIGLDGKPVGAKGTGTKVQPSKILLLYTNVQLNPELKPESFAFQAPSDATVIDRTEQLLIELEQAAAMQAEMKKAEAAKESELPQPISIPRPTAEADDVPPAKNAAPEPLKGPSSPAKKSAPEPKATGAPAPK
ncbi:MAG TPA: hypothetical protein VGZ22_26040 [Isosphaeraceae bacterium]|jgi:hypothetical protein|nr:hypothetical protein [Isosphaeraceae bacterium]